MLVTRHMRKCAPFNHRDPRQAWWRSGCRCWGKKGREAAGGKAKGDREFGKGGRGSDGAMQ